MALRVGDAVGTDGGRHGLPDAHVAAMDEADVEKEAVQVRKPAPKKK